MRRLALLRALLLALLCAPLCACSSDPAPTRIVLVTLDTLRWDAFEGAGGAESSMPLTRELARSGAVFRRFFAASNVTQPSHASMFTGKHPWEHGVTRNGLILGAQHTTVAEHLQAAGFATAAVVASFPLQGRFGFARGFEQYHEEFESALGDDGEPWEGHDVPGGRFYALADRITEQALTVLDTWDAPRQFLWVHYFDPHDPYGNTEGQDLELPKLIELARQDDPRLEQRLGRARRLYDRDVAALDRSLAALLERALGEAGSVETHVLVVSDHGESFGEGGALGHGGSLTEEQMHVPAFLVSPDVAAGVRDEPAGSVDVAATLLALAGADASVGGRDLTRGPERGGELVVGMRRSYAAPLAKIRVGGSEIQFRDRFFAVVDGELHAGTSDAVSPDDERGAVATDAVSSRLRPLFRGYEDALLDTAAAAATDPETEEALRALGYVR